MASVASEAATGSLQGDARATARHAHDTVSAAWLCVIPCTGLVIVVILLLGPPLGRLMTPRPEQFTFLLGEQKSVEPEPTEHARYLLALGAPLLGALAVVLTPRWLPRIPARLVAAGELATQALLAGLVVAAIVAQRRLAFGASYIGGEAQPFHFPYFTLTTLIVAALLAVLAVLTMHRSSINRRASALLRESRGARWGAAAIALVATVVWVLPAVNSDWSIAMAPDDLLYHLAFPFDETFAVLNGRTPLVNFTAQYSSLWPYVIALSMAIFGRTLLAFTLTVCAIGTLAMLTVFSIFRRAAGSSLAALLLYLPFLASSLFLLAESFGARSTVGTYFGTFPLRYAGPWFVAWLTARLLSRHDRATSRETWLLFTAAGLALLNNGDFGVAATGASVAAVVWTSERRDLAMLLRLGGLVAAGVATAFALVSLVTLARTGTLPQPDRLVDYAQLYALSGYALDPIPGVLGIHLLIYVTYVASIIVATVHAVRRAPNRVLTGMLAWSGIFGLGAGAYYVGRSHPAALTQQFSAWAFALALLTVAAAGALAAMPLRRVAIGASVVLFGFGVMTCSLAQVPAPWSQLQRLDAPFVTLEEWRSPNMFVPPGDPPTRRFVASVADGPGRFVYEQGAPVAILLTLGHRIAEAYGVRNVSPYTGIESLQTVQRVEAALDALRDAGGNTVILPAVLDASIFPVLERRGFEVLTTHGLRHYVAGRTTPYLQPWPIVGGVMRWVDTRHLHPRALLRGLSDG